MKRLMGKEIALRTKLSNINGVRRIFNKKPAFIAGNEISTCSGKILYSHKSQGN